MCGSTCLPVTRFAAIGAPPFLLRQVHQLLDSPVGLVETADEIGRRQVGIVEEPDDGGEGVVTRAIDRARRTGNGRRPKSTRQVLGAGEQLDDLAPEMHCHLVVEFVVGVDARSLLHSTLPRPSDDDVVVTRDRAFCDIASRGDTWDRGGRPDYGAGMQKKLLAILVPVIIAVLLEALRRRNTPKPTLPEKPTVPTKPTLPTKPTIEPTIEPTTDPAAT